MYIGDYSPKRAMRDVLKFLAYRVQNPNATAPAELLEAEARLRDLNSGELLDAVGAALRSGINPGIERPAQTPTPTPLQEVSLLARGGRFRH